MYAAVNMKIVFIYRFKNMQFCTALCDAVLQAQYDASELITQREIVSHKITDELTKRSAHFGLILDDISIVSLFIRVLLTICFRYAVISVADHML